MVVELAYLLFCRFVFSSSLSLTILGHLGDSCNVVPQCINNICLLYIACLRESIFHSKYTGNRWLFVVEDVNLVTNRVKMAVTPQLDLKVDFHPLKTCLGSLALFLLQLRCWMVGCQYFREELVRSRAWTRDVARCSSAMHDCHAQRLRFLSSQSYFFSIVDKQWEGSMT